MHGVTFDFWNTLVAERPDSWKTRRAAQIALLEAHGVVRTPGELDAATTAMRVWFDESWVANRVVDPASAAERLVAELRVDDAALVAELTEVFLSGGDPATLNLAPGIGDALEALNSRGVAVGIICDTGFTPGVTLRRYLQHHGLLQHFAHWSFSNEVGVFKPDPKIFAHAAEGLGVDDPTALAHVGDLRRTDVGGATGVGWTAVRYRGLNDDAPGTDEHPDAAVVIDHHDELVAALGLD